MSVLEQFGVRQDELPDTLHGDLPITVKGRTVHIDADFLAYQVSYDEEATTEDMIHNLQVAIETIRLLAGAEKTKLHLTATGSTKGDRYDIAIQREYQECRKNVEKPKYLQFIKDYMVDKMGGTAYTEIEADDALSLIQSKMIAAGKRNQSIISSRDKDLMMVQGLHLDDKTGEITDVNGFGNVFIDGSGSVPKLRGVGYKFFWAQMLMGDPADSIRGLPALTRIHLPYVKPTAAVTKYMRSVNAGKSPKDVISALKPKSIGPSLANEILQLIDNNQDAFEIVKELYKTYGEEVGFTHWRTGGPVHWTDVLISEAKMLWMRKYSKEEDDVLLFFRKVINGRA